MSSLSDRVALTNNHPRDGGRRWALALLLGIVQLVVALILLLAALGKVVEFGLHGHVTHFTNWSWTFQTLFYFGTLAAPLLVAGLADPHSSIGTLTQLLIVLFFFPLHGIVWVVVIVVQVLLGTDADFLADLLTELPPTLVMLGNDVFHFWPVIFVLLFALGYGKLIAFAFNDTLNRYGVLRSPVRTTIFVLYQAYAGTGIAVAMYSVVFNPQQVYRTDIHVLIGVGVAALVLTVFNLLPLLLLLDVLRVGTDRSYPSAWLGTNFADPALFASDDNDGNSSSSDKQR
jgi:hypothetical protein